MLAFGLSALLARNEVFPWHLLVLGHIAGRFAGQKFPAGA